MLGYNFISAQTWAAPNATPPNDNTATPINVGATTQSKSGNFASNILAATTEMRSNRYCDAVGNNCFASGDVQAVANAGRQWVDYSSDSGSPLASQRWYATVYQNTTGTDLPLAFRLSNNTADNAMAVFSKNTATSPWVERGRATGAPGTLVQYTVPPGGFYTADAYIAGCVGTSGAARMGTCNYYVTPAQNSAITWKEYRMPPTNSIPSPW